MYQNALANFTTWQAPEFNWPHRLPIDWAPWAPISPPPPSGLPGLPTPPISAGLPKLVGLPLLPNRNFEAMGAQLISGAQQISMVLGLGSQGDQMAERANGSPGSPINQELMEPIELWSLVTSGTQQPWKPTGSPVPYGAHQVVKFILIRWMR